MRFDDDQQLDTSDVDDQRGRGGGGGFPGMGGGRSGFPFPFPQSRGGKMAGGGMGMLGILLALLLGGKACAGGGGGGLGIPGLNLPDLNQQAPNAVPANPDGASIDLGGERDPSGDSLAQNCRTGADANQRQDCRFVAVANSLETFWQGEFERRDIANRFRPTTTNFFTGAVDTGCGGASSEVGPFYCPRDEEIYLDLAFFDELQSKFGARGGDFAEAYVHAHEYGHHIQNLLGISAKVEQSGDRQGENSAAVRLELQADCLAGVWANNATSGSNPLIVELTDDDIREGLDAAAAVGDDRIQAKFQGQVTPHTWTHGSAKQRQKWFANGFRSGELSDCDTFNQDI